MRRLRAIVLSLTVLASAPAFAVQPDEVLANPALESRARALSQELRCLVCQNQSIDDSDAQLARDLRILLRERLKAGDSDQQVLDFLVARYGKFVLLRPRFEWHTALLWLAPGLLLLAGAFGIVLAARRRLKPALAEAPLSAQESARLRRLTEHELP
jgi:cytochrome c-type biogenesis protein CcmH